MRIIDVDSSAIDQLQYEYLELSVVFKDGKVYKYLGVSPEVFDVVSKSESIGRAYNNLVKNTYEYVRVK